MDSVHAEPQARRTSAAARQLYQREKVIKMKILVVIRRSPAHRYLVELKTDSLVKEIARLAGRGRRSQAIATALAKGRLEGEVAEGEISKVQADLILTEENVRWDLMGR